MHSLPLGNIQIIIHVHLKDTLIIIYYICQKPYFHEHSCSLEYKCTFLLSLHLVLRHILIGFEYQLLIVENVLFPGFYFTESLSNFFTFDFQNLIELNFLIFESKETKYFSSKQSISKQSLEHFESFGFSVIIINFSFDYPGWTKINQSHI